MKRIPYLRESLLVVLFLSLAAWSAATARAADDRVDYNRQIRPILSNNCFTCHGPDEKQRQAGLRLDTREGAVTKLESGEAAVIPGKSAASSLLLRIASHDADEQMPPADSGKKLTAKQIDLIKRWIDQGAEWQGHWSFTPIIMPKLPPVKDPSWVRNPIDQFVLARLQDEGLKPSPEADKETLIRRVTFDLTGLPPTLAEVDAFLADMSPNAYEKVVDRLLASPRYGEHMARYWLDAARYGDTHGLHLDNERSLWPYRDWVIGAFNKNLPFDQFTVEQLAGDLLPTPRRDQLVATGFNRCNVTTGEGGSIDEEYIVRYAVDRVETTSTVWLGLTAGCAACHDHKFDPITQKEFYQLYSYFHNLTERAMDGNALLPPPSIPLPTPEQAEHQERLKRQVALLEQTIKTEVASFQYVDPQANVSAADIQPQDYVWIDDDVPAGAVAASTGPEGWAFVSKPEHPVLLGSKSSRRQAPGLSQHFFTAASPGLVVGAGDKLFANVYLDPKNPPKEIMLQFNDGSWDHRAVWGENVIDWGVANTPGRVLVGPLPEPGKWTRIEIEASRVGLAPGSVLNGWAFTQFDGTVYWDAAGIVTRTPQGNAPFESQLAWEEAHKPLEKSPLPKEIQDLVKIERAKRTPEQIKRLRDYFVENVYPEARPFFAPLQKHLGDLKGTLTELEKRIPNTMVMQEMATPRETYVLTRGEYDKPDKTQRVTPNVPAAFPPVPAGAPANRLGLAQWIVDPKNPLTARVTVNRYWQHYFGNGIVRTAEDFGAQGEWPSHPFLLDWLATTFIHSGWDIKGMQKLIVTSATYRQSSKATPASYQRDRDNILLSRGPRFRMEAEVLRDQALTLSGLLVGDIGGRSVKPYQPSGLWEAVGYTDSNTAKFVQDHGDALYRRSMYIFWKRTSPPPTMTTFDAPSRESCTVRRPRTNTPLQALTLMNDIQYVEAARHLAERMMTEGGASPQQRIEFAFRLATARKPDAQEAKVFLDVFQSHLADYNNDKEGAIKLLSVGESKRNESLNPSELAAWTMIANLILNLDETVTKG